MGSSRMDMKFTLKATASATWGINPHTDPAAKDETVGTGSKRRLESLGVKLHPSLKTGKQQLPPGFKCMRAKQML